MGFREVLDRMKEKKNNRKELIQQMADQRRFEQLVEDRTKSSNEREMERFDKENREESIKERLEGLRKERSQDIRFGHNPLDTPNITSGTQWQVLKEKNQFSGRSNMFAGNQNIHKSNNKLLRSGNILKSNKNVTKMEKRFGKI